MKMYILIKEHVPNKHAIVAAAHASLACYLRFQNDKDMQEWISGPFNKVVCSVNENEMIQAKNHGYFVDIRESKLDDALIAVAFKPRKEWPSIFKSLNFWDNVRY